MEKNQSWSSEFAESFKTLAPLYEFLGWPLSQELESVAKTYPVFVPKRLAKKIKDQGGNGPLAQEFLPHVLELRDDGLTDPIGDEAFFKAPQLIHRYENRALFTPTSVCPIHCRYCFRKNELNSPHELFQNDFDKTLSYLRENPKVTEIIFTGGDPLTLSNERLEKFLSGFAGIFSIKDIRFHTRYPVILPSRIDEGFLKLIAKYQEHFRTISLVIHANHASEFDEETDRAIKKLSQTGMQLLSQSVLLKGVNNNSHDLFALMNKFIENKIRPYYLHHPDKVKGGLHFSLPLKDGRELYLQLRDKLPGWAIPHYVIDLPGGAGKISAFNPESLDFSGKFLTKAGDSHSYEEIK